MIFYKTNYGKEIYPLREKVMPKLLDILTVDLSKEKSNFDPMVNFGTCTYWEGEEGKNLHTWPEFQDLLTFIKPHLLHYCQLNNISKTKFDITGMWANVYYQYALVKPHQHSVKDDIISSVFYLEKPEKSGDLHISVPTEGLPEDHHIELKEGDIIFFPSQFMHWTDPNLNTDKKVIIGIDYYKGEE